MAVIEYMLVRDMHRRQVPEFVGDRGHWMSPIDNTFIGWVDDVRDYYVPDTIVYYDKAGFVARQLAIHAHTPFTKPDPNDPDMINMGNRVNMTNEEVTAQMEDWYDEFVARNS